MLAYRIFRGVDDNVDPEKNLMVRLVRRFYPVTDDFREGHWFVKEGGRRYVTPLFLALVAVVFADIAFAIDSIPAAFAITTDPLLIWMGNVFALLGLRALFVLVESLIARFRYLDETIAVVLGLVGVKLLIEDVVKIGPLPSLGRDRRGVHDRHLALRCAPTAVTRTPSEKREERMEHVKETHARRGRAGRAALALAGSLAPPGDLPLERCQPAVPLAPTSAIHATASDIGSGVER